MKRMNRTEKILLVGLTLVGGWAIISSAHSPEVLRLPETAPQPRVERVPDLTSGALPVVLVSGQDPIAKATMYEVSIKNLTAGPLQAKSLVIVLDGITDNLTGEEVSERVQVLSADGWTVDGKAYFRVPSTQGEWIASSDMASPIRVKLREHDKIPAFTPSFRVRELHMVG